MLTRPGRPQEVGRVAVGIDDAAPRIERDHPFGNVLKDDLALCRQGADLVQEVLVFGSHILGAQPPAKLLLQLLRRPAP